MKHGIIFIDPSYIGTGTEWTHKQPTFTGFIEFLRKLPNGSEKPDS